MRFSVVLAVALVAAGCGSSGESGGNVDVAAPRVEKCVERFLARATSDASSEH